MVQLTALTRVTGRAIIAIDFIVNEILPLSSSTRRVNNRLEALNSSL